MLTFRRRSPCRSIAVVGLPLHLLKSHGSLALPLSLTSWDTTRDKERFQLLFQENVNYGFRRKLWAMKPVGIAISILSLAALALVTQIEARADAVPWFANLTAIAIVALLLTWWLVRITPSWVKIVADAYALRLLASIDELEGAQAARRDLNGEKG